MKHSGNRPHNDRVILNPKERVILDGRCIKPDRTPALSSTRVSSRQQMKLGTWNLRTMNSTGKLELVESEMQRYKINVMGLAETKWKGDAGHYFSDA